MRDRARDLITNELGPRTDHEIRRTLERQIETERWTNLDRQLARDSYRTGVVDLAPRSDRQRSEEHTSELQSLMRISYAVFCLKKKTHLNTSSAEHYIKTIQKL